MIDPLAKREFLRYHILMNVQYTLIRAKRTSIEIKVSSTGEVIVRAPLYTTTQKIESVLQQRADWIEKIREKMLVQQTWFDSLDHRQTEQLREMAKERLGKKTAYFASRMGLTYQKITITSAKKRLGSCSADGRICYSLYLLLYPDAAIDYVVVHELAHLVELNHSKDFYKVIECYLPDWRERKELLQPEYMQNPLAKE